jgi:hypothetical protein
MEDIQILTQLLNGEHLSNTELKRAATILNSLNTELKNRKN